MLIIELFFMFFKIGLFSIGGGYAMIPLMQQELVGAKLMTMTEVTDMVAVSQMTPGPIAVNAATFAGMRVYGVLGAIVATVGVVLPCAIVSLVVAKFFFKKMYSPSVQGVLFGIRPTVISLIAGAMVTIAIPLLFTGPNIIDVRAMIIFIGVFCLAIIKDVSPFKLIALSALLGLIFYAPIY